MKLNTLFIPFLILIFSLKIKAQERKVNLPYSTGEIKGLQSFLVLTNDEKSMDSIEMDSSWIIGKFSDNRGRIFLQTTRNNKPESEGLDTTTGIPAICICYTYKDTITIKPGIGFFGGMGLIIKVSKNDFNSRYFLFIDQDDTFKSKLSDKKFTGQIVVDNSYQKLVLLKKPDFSLGEQITGLLDFTTYNYYEKRNQNTVDTLSHIGKVYFTCKPRKKNLTDFEF
jgi:hypothetical protein